MRSHEISTAVATALGLALLAAVLIGCGSGDKARRSGQGPATHAAIGFSDEDPAFFTNPYFRVLRRKLRLSTVRLIAPYDQVATTQSAAWLSAARGAGLSP